MKLVFVLSLVLVSLSPVAFGQNVETITVVREGVKEQLTIDREELAQAIKEGEKAQNVVVESMKYNKFSTAYERFMESNSVVVDVTFKVQKDSKMFSAECGAKVHDRNKSVLAIENLWDCTWKDESGMPIHLLGFNVIPWNINLPITNIPQSI